MKLKIIKTPSKRGKSLVFITYMRNTIQVQLILGRVVTSLFVATIVPGNSWLIRKGGQLTGRLLYTA